MTNLKKKKKKIFLAKKQAVAELKNKKRTFWGKKCEKKLSLKTKNFQKKKKRGGIWGQTKRAGAEVKKKKIGEKMTNFQKHKWLELIFWARFTFWLELKKCLAGINFLGWKTRVQPFQKKRAGINFLGWI